MGFVAKAGAWIAGIFSNGRGADVALNIVEKISGTDWTPKEQAQFVIDYQNATKHQSAARRFIAIAFTFGMALFGFVYIATSALAYLYVFFSSTGDTLAQVAASQNLAEIRVKPLLTLKNDAYVYMKEVLSNPMTWILGFYFAVDIGSKFRK